MKQAQAGFWVQEGEQSFHEKPEKATSRGSRGGTRARGTKGRSRRLGQSGNPRNGDVMAIGCKESGGEEGAGQKGGGCHKNKVSHGLGKRLKGGQGLTVKSITAAGL